VRHEKHGSRLHVVLQIYTISSPLRRETTLFHRVSSRRKCLDSRIINPKRASRLYRLAVHASDSLKCSDAGVSSSSCRTDLFARFNRPSTIRAGVLSIPPPLPKLVSTTLRQLLARDPFLAKRKGKESYILFGETFTGCRIYLPRREMLRLATGCLFFQEHVLFFFFFFFFNCS